MKNVLIARESSKHEYSDYYSMREDPKRLFGNNIHTFMMELEADNYASISVRPIIEQSKVKTNDNIGNLAVKFCLLPVYGKNNIEAELVFDDDSIVRSIKPEYVVLVDGKYRDPGLDWQMVKSGYIRSTEPEAKDNVVYLSAFTKDYPPRLALA